MTGLISPRDLHFAADPDKVSGWRRADPVSAVFFDNLSALFPQGERFFIDSVKGYRDRLSVQLASDVQQFVMQEAIHTREHLAFNTQVSSAGYDITRMETRTRRQLDRWRQRDEISQLAITVALEHLTAVMAHCILADPAFLGRAPPEIRRLWQWHALEEIEHKAVAFDTLMAVTASWPTIKRWAFRCAVFCEAMYGFVRVAGLNLADLRRQDGPDAFKAGRLFGFLVSRPGLLRQVSPKLFGYLAPGFHPWRLDDSGLAQTVLAEPHVFTQPA